MIILQPAISNGNKSYIAGTQHVVPLLIKTLPYTINLTGCKPVRFFIFTISLLTAWIFIVTFNSLYRWNEMNYYQRRNVLQVPFVLIKSLPLLIIFKS